MHTNMLAVLACALLISPAIAQDAVLPQLGGPNAPTEPVEATPISPMRTNCYTNVQDCAGVSPFNAGSSDWSCTIFWNNGTNGHSNFTIRSGASSPHQVRYNDTSACVAGLNGGSENASRSYIWVP
jgi:uncharacterized protein YgiB involved in biofilm formation